MSAVYKITIQHTGLANLARAATNVADVVRACDDWFQQPKGKRLTLTLEDLSPEVAFSVGEAVQHVMDKPPAGWQRAASDTFH